MKAAIIGLLFFVSVNAQNVWYVDRDATGANTGRSWANAWTTTDSVWGNGKGINWQIIGPGDTIYISGGTDSTRYGRPPGQACPMIRGNDAQNPPITFNQKVVITPAWHAGHNGEVWFYTTDTTQIYTFIFKNISDVKMVNINFMADMPVGTWGNMGAVLVENSSRLEFNNCTFTNARTGGALSLQGCNYITISNSTIQNFTNSSITDQDILTPRGGAGGHIFRNNTIIQRCIVDSTDSHPDFIQFGSSYGDETYAETLFENNFMWQITPGRKSEYNAGIYISSGTLIHQQRFTFINNIFVLSLSDTTYANTVNSAPAIWLRGFDGADNSTYSLRLFNNTFIAPGASLLLTECDTLIAKNNFFIQTNDIQNNYALAGWRGYPAYQAAFLDVDYNHWYVKNWHQNKRFQTGDSFHSYNWAGWRGLGYDVHGDTGYVNLVDVKDSLITAYYTQTGRNSGADLSYLSSQYPGIMYDILGNPRGQGGSWDIGALEYQGTQNNNLNLKGKIFLQGPFNSTAMSTNLVINELLPNTQPFNTSPWNYNGNETLSSGSTETFVDWVLIELRNSSNPSQVVARKAAILKNDGNLLHTDGNTGVPFSNILAGSYYISVTHRNHLTIMSAAPVPLSANSQLYDFTTGLNKAYGTNPMANLGNGRYGMFAGDGNSDGSINLSDRNDVWAPQNGTIGYLNGDFNLDGGVTVNDINLYWNINNGKVTQLP